MGQKERWWEGREGVRRGCGGLLWATVASPVAGRRSQSSPQVGAVADPRVGGDSSKPPRLLVTVASPWVSGPSRRRLAGAGRRKPKPPRRGEVAVAEPWVGVDSSKPPRLYATIAAVRRACHAGATRGRVGGNFTHPRRPRRRLAEDGKICLPLRGGTVCGGPAGLGLLAITSNITRMPVIFM